MSESVCNFCGKYLEDGQGICLGGIPADHCTDHDIYFVNGVHIQDLEDDYEEDYEEDYDPEW